MEHPDQSTHGFGAFITFSSKYPDKFVLRYRTDHGVTGEIIAMHRKPRIARNIEQANNDANRDLNLFEKSMFALRWT